jgi:hypothetical protein
LDMALRKGLTDKQLAALPRKSKRYILADPDQRGHYVRVPPEGPITFTAVARDPYGRQIWTALGTTADLKIGQARDMARQAIRRVKEGKSALEPPKPRPDSVAVVAEGWLTRHVEKNKHRSAAEMRRIVERYILPVWKDHLFRDIRRSYIAAFLDSIEDKHGPAMADAVLATLRSIATWVQARDDTYAPPFTRCGASLSQYIIAQGY